MLLSCFPKPSNHFNDILSVILNMSQLNKVSTYFNIKETKKTHATLVLHWLLHVSLSISSIYTTQSIFTCWLKNITTIIIYSCLWRSVVGKQVSLYLELKHYCYWGLFKGKGSIGNGLLYDNIRFSWREMWAEIFKRQRGPTPISRATRFWTSVIPHCLVLKACLFSHSLVSITTQV